MAWSSPMAVKFSNLLQTNPESTVYGIDLSTFSNIETGHNLFEKLRRKSVNIGSLKSKRAIESFSPEVQTKNIEEIINKSKINRLLMEANFEKEINIPKASKKRMYVIRKKQQRTRVQSKDKRFQNEKKEKRSNTQNGEQSDSEGGKTKYQQMFKVKRKIPKFGIEDIAPKINSKRNSFCQQKTANLFMSTSSNNFYNTSFYMSSKIRELHEFREERRLMVNQLTPEVTNLVPHPLNKEYALEKKKLKQKFYCTNNGFSFVRSKTEEFEPNLVCGWEKWQQEENDNEGLT